MLDSGLTLIKQDGNNDLIYTNIDVCIYYWNNYFNASIGLQEKLNV